MASQVKFRNGLYAEYAALGTKDAGTLYFCTDTHQIFLGDAEYTKGTKVLTAEPTSATPGNVGMLYAYNGNLYLCSNVSGGAYTYVRVANINDEGGTVTSIGFGEGLTGGDGTSNPITDAGVIQHAVPTGASVTADGITDQTATFGGTVKIVGIATDKFGHVTGVNEHSITMPTETAVTVETATGSDVTLAAGDSFTVVSDVTVGDADQSVKRTSVKFTLPEDKDTTYTVASNEEGKILVTPSEGEAYSVTINGWDTLAKKADIVSVFIFKGVVAKVADLPKTAEVGHVYHVTEKSAEYVCVTASTETSDAVYEELGSIVDLSEYAKSADVIQRVTGAEGMVPQFTADGTLASTGFTIGVSVPADAKFTDTTYEDATQDVHGLMSTADKKKLDEIETGGQVNVIETVKVNGDALTVTDKAVNVTIETGATPGTVKVNGKDVAVEGIVDAIGLLDDGSAFYSVMERIYDEAKDAQYEPGTSIGSAIADALAGNATAESNAKAYTDAEIAKLDATVTQTAGADGLALEVVETDGKLTSVTGSIAANTYYSYTDGTTLAGKVDTLNGEATVDGSVANSIKNQAKDATYSESMTIGGAIDDLYDQIGEGGGVAQQIKDAIDALDATVDSGDVESGKGIKVTVTEDAGKLASVTVEGNFDAAYDSIGSAAAVETSLTAITDGLSDEIDTLKGAVTEDGSILKMIKDNAKDATYSVEGEKTTTIAEAIQEAKESAVTAGKVTVVKQETAESGFSATYYVTQNNEQVGAKINIPKDFLVKSGKIVKFVKAEDGKYYDEINDPSHTNPIDALPTGVEEGKDYLDFVVNAIDGTAEEQHMYIDVTHLCEVYTGSDNGKITVSISEGNVISATIDDGTITRDKIDSDFEGDIAALEATHGTKEDGSFKTVSEQITAEAANATYSDTASIKDALDDLYDQIGEGGGVAAQIEAAINALNAEEAQDATAENGQLALHIKEEAGVITSITGSITANTYDAYGAAQAVADTLGTAAPADVATVAIGTEGEAADALPNVGQVETYVTAQVTSALSWEEFTA